MRGIFVSKSKVNKSVTILLSVVLLVAILSSYILLSNSFTKIEEAYADSDFYIYGVEESEYVWNKDEYEYDIAKNGMVLHTSDGSSGTWKKSDEYRGNYATIGTGSSFDLKDLAVVDGWYKCGNSAPIHIMSINKNFDSDEATIGGVPAIIPLYGYCNWAVSNINSTLAYCIVQARFTNEGQQVNDNYRTMINVYGRYKVGAAQDPSYNSKYSGQSVWISTSYNDYWDVYASTESAPESVYYDDAGEVLQIVDDVKAHITNAGVNFEIKLGEGQRALNIMTDIQVGRKLATEPLFGPHFSADSASMTAVLKDD